MRKCKFKQDSYTFLAEELFTAVWVSADPGRSVPSMTICEYVYDIDGGVFRHKGNKRDSRDNVGDLIVAQRKASKEKLDQRRLLLP